MDFEKRIISNDAWHLIMHKEEPLDELAVDEAEALRAEFKGGGCLLDAKLPNGTVSIFIIPADRVEDTLLGSFDPNMAADTEHGLIYVEWLECDTTARYCIMPQWQVHTTTVVDDKLTLPDGSGLLLTSSIWGTVEPRR